MPYKNPEDKKKYDNEYGKQWYQNNKEHRQEQQKEYNQSESGIKSRRISTWKSYEGMSQDYNWDEIYITYISTDFCHYCDVELVEGNYGSNKKCLDHHHITGEIRGILCNTCNSNEVLA